MKYTTYIFDLDGTLLNTLQDLANAVNHTMCEMGYPEHTIDEVCSFVGNGIWKLIERSLPEESCEDEIENAYNVFIEYYSNHLYDFTKPYEKITEVLTYLKQKGCKLAVVSNKDDSEAKSIVHHFFGNVFDITVGKSELFPAKPAPDSVIHAMKLLLAQKEKTVYIGDSEVDVQTAHNAGLECIGVTWGFRGREILKKHNAEMIIDKPDEIITLTKN